MSFTSRLSPPTSIRLKDGTRLSLGARLGEGGEAAVYEIQDMPSRVAKIYLAPQTKEKEKKLQLMTALEDRALQNVAAWPVDLARDPQDGRLRGFVMPRLNGFHPLHTLYTPSSRKGTFPSADWKYLVHAARNLAAAFAVVHEKGHVIGDVNQGNSWVHGVDATCKLIDCDSFQISMGADTYRCEVVTGHFTPPELQARKSFVDCTRTSNHDNFGLAVLLFHLVFFGRHPFAGIHAGDEYVSLEEKIEKYWYAYSSKSLDRHIKPPPGTLPVAIAGNRVESMFERAFSRSGAARPTSHDWAKALAELETSLRRCGEDGAHTFPSHLPQCPWCALEEKTGTLLFVTRVTTRLYTPSHFDIGMVWADIEGVKPATQSPPVGPEAFSPVGRPLPFEVRARNAALRVAQVAIVAAGVSLFIVQPALWFLILIGVVFLWRLATPNRREQKERANALATAESKYRQLLATWEQHQHSPFHKLKRDLEVQKAEYVDLPRRYQQEIAALKKNLRASQLEKFLERFSIQSAQIKGIGDSRRQTLISFGIDSAARVNRSRVLSVHGIGEKFADRIVAWRRDLEKKFVFDESRGVSPEEISKLNRKIDHRKKEIEALLVSAVPSLRQQVRAFDLKTTLMLAELAEAAKSVAHARADFAMLKRN